MKIEINIVHLPDGQIRYGITRDYEPLKYTIDEEGVSHIIMTDEERRNRNLDKALFERIAEIFDNKKIV